jgi:thiamine pyrophosphate-dependent acetolactate synthase large subunit-like protein
MKASDLFIKCLEEEGVTRIFGVPGEENADFMILFYAGMSKQQHLWQMYMEDSLGKQAYASQHLDQVLPI